MPEARDPLKLYWWAAKPNFGDAISEYAAAHASGREVVWANYGSQDISAIGSIMHMIRWGDRKPRKGPKPVVWGTGMLRALELDFVENVEFACVRGPVTEALLEIEVAGYGDPGLLMGDYLGPQERGERIGLIPHFSHAGDPAFQAMVEANPVLQLIDVRADPLEVCRTIGRCAHVVSSSLHGLIVADSFGVPNTWLNPAGIHVAPKLKFVDYAAGIDRAIGRPVELADLPAMLAKLPTGALPYAEGVARSKDDLMRLFPERLRG